MINIVNGDILNSIEDIIIHQVNVQGYMGGGVARELANQYINLEKEYAEFCKLYNNDYKQLKGQVLNTFIENKTICNMFSQKENFDTDYEAMKTGLTKIKEFAKDLKLSVCMPYGMGCRNCQWRMEQSL